MSAIEISLGIKSFSKFTIFYDEDLSIVLDWWSEPQGFKKIVVQTGKQHIGFCQFCLSLHPCGVHRYHESILQSERRYRNEELVELIRVDTLNSCTTFRNQW